MKENKTKKYSYHLRILAAMLAIVLTFSYMPAMEAEAASSKGKITSVSVTNLPAKTLTLKKGKSQTLKVKVAKTGKISTAVTFKSNKPKVVSVTSKGKVTAKKNGTAKVTIASKANKKKNVVITVTVGTPVTKVALNKTSVKIVTGKTATLKATVSAKKASNKKVVWSSSNTKVATVDSKGKVKGIKAGTAKITATAADGSGKKKTATVTVTDPVVLKNISVVNASTIKVDLSGAKQLSVSNFVVKLNKTGKGSYNKVCKVDNVVTTNNTSYLVVLDSNYTIKNQENVQVTVSGLDSGNASKTTVYSEGTFKYNDAETYYATYNERVDDVFSLSGTGYCASSVTGLPSGIKMEDHGTHIRFYGIPKQKGKVTTQIVSIDELGNTYTNTITWLISSEDTISANANPVYRVLGANGTVSISDDEGVYVRATGGSGSYIYSLSGTTYGLSIDEASGYISGKLMAAGTYTLTVNVQDRNNAAYKTTTNVVIYVSSAVSISGIVKDLSGNPIPNARIYYTNKDKASKYSTSGYVYSNNTGAFSMSLASGTYDIEAYYNDSHRYLYSQALTTTHSGFDITLPLQKVVIYSNNAAVDAQNFGTWKDADGESYGSGNTFWLKVGKYALTTTKQTGRQTITATVNLNVTEKQSVTATASVTVKITPAAGTITAGQSIPVAITGAYKYYTFTPATDGYYYFYSTGSVDTYGCIEDVTGNTLTFDDDDGINYNFYFSYYCTKGVTYYVGIRNLSDESATATLYVSTTNPSYDDDDDDYDDYMLQNTQPEAVADSVSDVEEEASVEEENILEEEIAVTENDLPAVEAAEAAETDEVIEADEAAETDEVIEADEAAEMTEE